MLQLESVLIEVDRGQCLHHALRVVNLNGKLFITKIQILQLLPLKDANWHLAVVVFILSNSFAGQSDPPGRGPLVVHLEVVHAVGWHGLHYCHVVDHRLAAGLARGLLVVLNHLVFAVGVGRLLLEDVGWQQCVLLQE